MNTSDHLARDGESLHAPLADEDPSGGGTCENDFGQEYYWPLVFRGRVGRFAGQKKCRWYSGICPLLRDSVLNLEATIFPGSQTFLLL